VYTSQMRVAVLLALTIIPASAQVVQTGQSDPNFCYKIEKIRPNLELSKPTHVSGTISDQALAPLANSRVELRTFISQIEQVSVAVVSTDNAGHFDLGTVKTGKYRLLASPLRAFAQPDKLVCANSGTCELKVTLAVNPTDMPISSCPVR
jgi:hypothetical protein